MAKYLGRRRRTRQELLELAGRFDESGLSIAAFCRQQKVSRASLQRRLGRRTMPLRLVEAFPPSSTTHGFIRHTAEGYRVEMDYQFPAEALTRLLKVLAQ